MSVHMREGNDINRAHGVNTDNCVVSVSGLLEGSESILTVIHYGYTGESKILSWGPPRELLQKYGPFPPLLPHSIR